MSSKITQVFRRTVFPTHFVAPRVQCLQSPRPYLPLSRTLKSWQGLFQEINQEIKDLRQKNDDISQQNKLLRNKLEEELHKYRYYDLVLHQGRNYDVPKHPRKWTINSAILNKFRNDVYFVDLEETNVPLLDKILSGEFVALYGARASGKSTRVFQAMEKLESQGIVCI
jgi:hypothetical protein